jgi:hypothetical protein
MLNIKFLTQKYIFFMTGMVFLISAPTSPVYALDWDDKNWKEYGCPENMLGSWVSRDKGDRLLIEAHRLIIKSNEGDQKYYSYKYSSSIGENRITEIILKSKNMDNESQRYLKIRPHIAQSPVTGSLQKEKTASCQIKVFQYENQKNAKLDKYMSWNIYKRK